MSKHTSEKLFLLLDRGNNLCIDGKSNSTTVLYRMMDFEKDQIIVSEEEYNEYLENATEYLNSISETIAEMGL